MIPKSLRRLAYALALPSLMTLSAFSQAQSTYSFTFPPPASVGAPFPFTGTTHPASYGPTMTRPNNALSGPPNHLAQSGGGVNVFYDAHPFTVPTDGTYDILSNCVSPNNWDNFTMLYLGDITQEPLKSQVINNALTNCLFANQDYTSSTSNMQSGFSYALTAGTTYTLVTTSSGNAKGGTFSNTISTRPTLGTPLLNVNGTVGPTTAGPTYNAPVANGFLAPTSVNFYPVYYSARDFTVPATGLYGVLSTCTVSPNWDNYTVLYVEDPNNPGVSGFDPNNPLNNCLIANESVSGFNTQYSGFTYSLIAGKKYTLVTSGSSANGGNGNAGYFTNTITPLENVMLDTWSDDTTTGNTWNSPNYYDILHLSTQATNVPYATHTWTATLSGTVNFAEAPTPSEWGSYIYIYKNSFDPTKPLTNLIASAGSVSITGQSGVATARVAVTKGTTYIAVVSGYNNNSYGAFNGEIDFADAGYSGTTVGGPTFARPNSTTLPTVPSTTANNVPYNAHTYHAYTFGSTTYTVTSTNGAGTKLWAALYAAPFDPTHPTTASVSTQVPDPGSLVAVANTGTTGVATLSAVTTYPGIDYVLVVTGDTNATAGPFTVSTNGAVTNNAPTFTYSDHNSIGPGNITRKILPNGSLPPVAFDNRYSTNGEVYYEADNFTVTTEGDYNISSLCTTPTTSWDNFLAIYHDSVNPNNANSFDPTNPLTNALIASEGLDSSGVTFASIHLTPGVYTLVTSGTSTFNNGGYTAVVAPITVPAASVVSYSGALTLINTTIASGFLSALPNANSLNPPTSLSTASTAKIVPYQSIPFTISTAGLYSIEVDSIKPENLWSNEMLLYKTSFDPSNPLTNCQFVVAGKVNGTGTFFGLPDNSTDTFLARATGVTLAAGNYILVVTGTSNANFGPFTANVYTSYLPYPPAIPDNSTTGLSATITVPGTDTFKIGSLDGVTITALTHPRVGDLLATLSHGGTTIELFDRVNHFTTSDSGSLAIFGGDYTFAGTGADLGAAAGGFAGSLVDPTQTYAQYLNGTAGVESSTLTGDFTAFNGMPVTGDWVLNLSDRKSGSVGSFTGFNFTVSPQAVSVSGKLTLDSIAPNAVAQTFTFTFHPVTGADVVKTASVGPDGNYTLNGVPKNTYTLRIKGWKYLAVALPVDTTSGNLTGVNATLYAGDANNDNLVDITDFGILVNAYSDLYDTTTVTLPDSDVEADFNGDGSVDIGDFGILINSYGDIGAP